MISCRVGDLTPHDDTSNKARDEHNAMIELAPNGFRCLRNMRLDKHKRPSLSSSWTNWIWHFRQKIIKMITKCLYMNLSKVHGSELSMKNSSISFHEGI